MEKRPVVFGLVAALVVGMVGAMVWAQASQPSTQQATRAAAALSTNPATGPAELGEGVIAPYAVRTMATSHWSISYVVNKADALGVTAADIDKALEAGGANKRPLMTAEELGRIKITAGGKTINLSDFASISVTPPREAHFFVAATTTAPAAAQALAFDKYDGYFVKNTFEPKAAASFVVLANQKAFDEVFGAGFVMNDKAHRLPVGAFDKLVVMAAIHRGKAIWEYKVEAVRVAGGVVSVVYSSKEQDGGGAEFAVPLIVSVPKGEYQAVEWVENGVSVRTVKMGGGM